MRNETEVIAPRPYLLNRQTILINGQACSLQLFYYALVGVYIVD